MSGPLNHLVCPRSAQGGLAAHRRHGAIPDRERGMRPGQPLASARAFELARQRARPSGASEHAVLAGAPARLFIGGAWRDAAGGRTLAIEDPATGEAICRVADASGQDALAALAGAAGAQCAWAARPPGMRSQILRRAGGARGRPRGAPAHRWGAGRGAGQLLPPDRARRRAGRGSADARRDLRPGRAGWAARGARGDDLSLLAPGARSGDASRPARAGRRGAAAARTLPRRRPVARHPGSPRRDFEPARLS